MKKKTRTIWTPHEEDVVREYVKKYSENINYALFLAAEELGKTHKAVINRWYNILKHQRCKKGMVFMLFSGFKNLINIKNQKKNYGK